MVVGVENADAALTPDRSLSLYSINTGERLAVEYCVRGRYLPDALRAVDELLRDHRTDTVHPIDPKLLDLLFAVRRRLETTSAFEVLSGYRSPETNALKRRTHRGVAKNSFHLQGRAVDVIMPGRSIRSIRDSALRLARGGVGYYPRSGFVHLDTGPVRQW
jgi:uncharacterized protein YcbK (DUF882 family)